jgi:hypothetical protein
MNKYIFSLSKNHLKYELEALIYTITMLTLVFILRIQSIYLDLFVSISVIAIIYVVDKKDLLDYIINFIIKPELEKDTFTKMNDHEENELIENFKKHIKKSSKDLISYNKNIVEDFLILKNIPRAKIDFKISFENISNFQRSYFMDRYQESNLDDENSFNIREINEFEKKYEIEIGNDAYSVWMTSLKIKKYDRDSYNIEILYYPVRYRNKYLLNWHLNYKFPREEEYPLKLVIDSLTKISDEEKIENEINYDYLRKIPANSGVNIFIITKDNKFILCERSGKEAVMRLKWQHAVSGSFDKTDFDKLDQDNFNKIGHRDIDGILLGAYREAEYELGIKKDEFSDLILLGIANIVKNNIIDFFFVGRINKRYDEIIKRPLKMDTEEYWENRKFKGFELQELINFNGKWRKFYERNYKNFTNQLVISLYLVMDDFNYNPKFYHF